MKDEHERSYVRLIAVEVVAGSELEASYRLVGWLATSGILRPDTSFECWWEADDLRTDGNDNDSAVFVRQWTQNLSRAILDVVHDVE